MKFGKQLQLLAIPEWRSNYMSYKKLKRILHRLPNSTDDDDANPSASDPASAAAIIGTMIEDNASDVSDLSRTASMLDLTQSPPNQSQGLGTPLMASSPTDGQARLLAQVEHDFFAVIEDDIARINAFSAAQRASIEQRVTVLTASAAHGGAHATPLARFYWSKDSLVDERALREVYCLCTKLRSFAVLNHDGLRKIVKKFDKTAGASAATARQPATVSRLATEPFFTADVMAVRHCVAQLEQLCRGPEQLASLRLAANRGANPLVSDGGFFSGGAGAPALSIAAAAAVALALAFAPLGLSDGDRDPDGDDGHAQRCLAVLGGVVVLWLTEALPYFVTALLVPVLVVAANVIPAHAVPTTAHGPSHGAGPLHDEPSAAAAVGAVSRADVAKFVLNSMFDKTIVLVLSGLVAASTVTRCQLELRMAAWLQRSLGHRPRLFMLAIMQLGLVASVCISNVTAPILLLSVIQPILRELPSSSRYARGLLLALAFACNLGGMLTPIASPQNAVALEALGAVEAEISFGSWLGLALPLVELACLAIWLVINRLYLTPCDVVKLPAIERGHAAPLTAQMKLMLGCVGCTVATWAAFSVPSLKRLFGDPALVGLLLLGVTFGSGFLGKADFNGLSWHLLALIAGGNALGLAVSSSGLLALAADGAMHHVLQDATPWLVVFELSIALLLIASFVSHTVAAIVVMPLVASIGAHAGAAKPVVFCAVLSISAAMALPMSSFPNVNSLLAEDDYGVPYLSPRDYVRAGAIASCAILLIIVTVGYPLAPLLLG